MLKSIFLNKNIDMYQYNIPSLSNLSNLSLDNTVTFFVGENGSGKSTLLESIALNTSLQTIGSGSLEQDQTMVDSKEFAKTIKLIWSLKNKNGFFLRAEDFFGFSKYLNHLKNDLREQEQEFGKTLIGYGRQLATATIKGQYQSVINRYGDLTKVSHGEGFLKLFQQRLVPDGLYLLDEPEAALSPVRQLSLISLIKEMENKNCQFIIATHSPILLAYPHANIYEFNSAGIQKQQYQNLDHVKITKTFLENPKAFVGRL